MKTNENQKSTNHQPSVQKPFFGATPDHTFFSAERAASPAFFQPKTISPSAIQAKSATSEPEGIIEPLVQQIPAFESELIAQQTEQRSRSPGRRENNTGLPDNLKSGIENLSGYSMDDVKVHYNSDKPPQLQAHAYAQGTDIHLASGQEKHLPHEAWHVVQQKQERVKPTTQMKGKININYDAGLEREADVMGKKAFQFVDNRPEAIAQRKLQEMANNSQQVKQLRAIQEIANNHSASQQQPIQKKENKSSVIQLNGNGKEDSGNKKEPSERIETPNFNSSSFLQGILQGPIAFFRAPITGAVEHSQLLLGGSSRERVQRIGQISQVINSFFIANANSIREQAQTIYPQLPLPAQQVIYNQGAFTLGSFIGSQITSTALARVTRTNPRWFLSYMLFSTTSKYFNMYYHFTNSGRFVENSASQCSDEIRKNFTPKDDPHDGNNDGRGGGLMT